MGLRLWGFKFLFGFRAYDSFVVGLGFEGFALGFGVWGFRVVWGLSGFEALGVLGVRV